MSIREQLLEYIKSSKDDFATANPQKLGLLVDNLSAVLADCDELGFDVVELLWQGCRHLRDCLDADPINVSALSEPMSKLDEIVKLLSGEACGNDDCLETSTDESVHVIPDEDKELIEDFVVEGMEHLEAAEGAMLDLEIDAENKEVLDLIFRSFHTIKGMAGFMSLDQISDLTHSAETLLDLARKGELLLVGNNADVVFQTVDMLKGMLIGVRNAIESDCRVLPYVGVKEQVHRLQACVSGESEIPCKGSAEESLEVLDDSDDHDSMVATHPSVVRKPHAQLEESIKVKTSRLDNLINMIGELVIAQLMVSESLKNVGMLENDKLEHDIIHQGKLIRDLQELSTSMRMVPINGIFQKMARLTRDLARQAGKNIDFSMEGEQTELDRTIVDKLADPLVHMIRNSVDHGIENAEDRKISGKSDTGAIMLRAFHAAGNIVIEVEDNGRGLNKDKLFEKGVRMGVFQKESSPSDTEIFNIIFTPGLSTAEKVTNVSGRGVGMDVVKRNIENLRGRIDIDSTQGTGTVFTISLPLTLAIIDGQIVRVGNEQFIVPINVIRKSFRPTGQDLHSVQGRGELISDRDDLLPLVRIHELFGVIPNSTRPEEGLVVVVEQDNFACGLLVDDLLDQQQVVIKNLGGILKNTPGISGGAIMGNGHVSLILDIPGIIKISQC